MMTGSTQGDDNPKDWAGRSWIIYNGLRVIVDVMTWLRILKIQVSGKEWGVMNGPALFIANHQSNLDPVLIPWCMKRPVSMPGKQELFGVPIFGWIIRQLGSFPVDRSASDSAALRRSLQLLRDRRLVLVFPEMTRTRTGEVGPFQETLTKLALRQQVPIIPVAIDGSGKVLGPGMKFPHFSAPVAIKIGPTVDLSNFYGRRLSEADVAEATEMVRLRVIDLLSQLRNQELSVRSPEV